jgi:hypothetical protein
MVSQTQSPYQTYAENPFGFVELQTIRLDIAIQQQNNWGLTTIDGSEKYWVRYRLVSGTLTTSPIINYYKLLANSCVIAEDGTIACHGLTRTLKTIAFDWNLISASGASAPSNQDIWYSSILKIARVNNKVANNRAVSACFLLPSDIDSGCPVFLNLAFCSTTTAINQTFTFSLTYANVEEMAQTYFSSPAAITYKNETTTSITLTCNATNGQFLEFQRVPLRLPTAISQNAQGETTQLIIFVLTRTSAGAPDIVFSQGGISYYAYKESGASVV